MGNQWSNSQNPKGQSKLKLSLDPCPSLEDSFWLVREVWQEEGGSSQSSRWRRGNPAGESSSQLERGLDLSKEIGQSWRGALWPCPSWRLGLSSVETCFLVGRAVMYSKASFVSHAHRLCCPLKFKKHFFRRQEQASLPLHPPQYLEESMDYSQPILGCLGGWME